MSKSMKPAAHAATPKPLTDEEKRIQAARLFLQKRESFLMMILSNAVQSGRNADLKELVDESLEAADYAIEKLYPMPKEGEE